MDLIHLTIVLFVSCLPSSEAIVPSKGSCWTDRIIALSGTLTIENMCNVTRRCASETFLLESATEECGQASISALLRNILTFSTLKTTPSWTAAETDISLRLTTPAAHLMNVSRDRLTRNVHE
uniref:Elicitin-like protein n=1 Tax=Steinernema glaseri TaxID=37863 RepID=A0A1I7ZFI3_9BILA